MWSIVAEPGLVVVTGAAGGIGQAVCRRYAGFGHRVVGLDIDEVGLAALGDGIEQRVVDLTNAEIATRVVHELGDIDVLIHCAGITSLGPFLNTPAAAFDKVLNVNLGAAVTTTRAALPGLISTGGRIAVLSSVSGFSPLLYRTAYAASKHALHGFFESLRAELADEGVSVTMICPSFVETGIERRAAHHGSGISGTWTTTGKVMSPDRLADSIYRSVDRRARLVLPSVTSRLAYGFSRLSPALYERLMRQRIGRGE